MVNGTVASTGFGGLSLLSRMPEIRYASKKPVYAVNCWLIGYIYAMSPTAVEG